MSYDGWLSLAGTPVVNSPQTLAYARNVLSGVVVEDPCDTQCTCDHLHDLIGDPEYTSPLIDDAVWVDPDHPESYDFLGLMSTEVIGLSDDTVTATKKESLGNGGWVTGTRRAMREIRVKGVLVSASSEGAHYGETWLKAALEGSCDDGGCGVSTSTLCFLSACVDPSEFGGSVVRRRHRNSELKLSDGAHWNSGTLVFPRTASFATLSLPAGTCGPVEWTLDLTTIRGGASLVVAHDGREERFLLPQEGQLIRITSQDTSITLRAERDSEARPIDMTRWTTMSPLQAGQAAHWTDRADSDPTAARWVTGSSADTPVDLAIEFNAIRSSAREEVGDSSCLDDVIRYMRRVVRTEGPIFGTEQIMGNGAVIRDVSFILTAEMPYIYGEVMPVISGSLTEPRMLDADVMVSTIPAIPNCVPEAGGALGFVRDPLRPATPKPPAQQQVRDPLREGVVSVTGYSPYAILIPAEMISDWQNVVPVFEISTGATDARFISIRFFPMPLDSTMLSDIDPCSVCGEFEIAYIPSNSTFVADATEERGWIKQQGRTDTPASHLLTDSNGVGGPTWPALSCGSAYLVVIDSHGQPLGDVNLWLAVRE